jgi:L-alanine-DL-glutamate epimerase-like enolase superfamily enzyme
VNLPARLDATVEALDVSAFEIPTESPESDGTLEWDSTTVVVVRARSGAARGLGYTYSAAAAAKFVDEKLADVVVGRDAFAVPAAWSAMNDFARNLGHEGLTQMAIAAVDIALWDLKAHLLDLPLSIILGRWRERVPIYGSGGFTSYPVDVLQDQLAGWVKRGIPRVKMKVGRDPDEDIDRVAAAREAIGDSAELFVDANGAFTVKQALAFAHRFAEYGVTWFEEPVSSDDLSGLRLVREGSPVGMDIAAGEYGFNLDYFRRMLEMGAVDVIQPDVTRCGGITGFLPVAALSDAMKTPVSAHTAPQVSMHACTAVRGLRHLEYFHDHARIESLLFDGVRQPKDGFLEPDLSRPGMGLELKDADAAPYCVYGNGV